MKPKSLTPEQIEQAYLIFEQLETGRTVLKDLRDSYYDRISFNPNQPDPQVTAYREGQRSVVQYIVDTLEKLSS